MPRASSSQEENTGRTGMSSPMQAAPAAALQEGKGLAHPWVPDRSKGGDLRPRGPAGRKGTPRPRVSLRVAWRDQGRRGDVRLTARSSGTHLGGRGRG